MLNRIHKFLRGGSYYFFRYDDTVLEKDVLREELFSITESDQVFKRSRSCFAAKITLPGTERPFFYKQNPRNTWKYTLRYLFRKARVFKAAKVTEHLIAAGVPTPAVYFCGMKRRFFLPVCGCSASEFLENTVSAGTLLEEARSGEEMEQIIRRLAELMRLIHEAGVYHGDLKLYNIYKQNETFGIIDLDGSIIFRKKVPLSYRKKDMVRLAVGIIHGKKDDFSLLPEVCRIILEHGGTDWTVSGFSEKVFQFFKRKPPA